MTAYSYNNDGKYIGTCECQVDPIRSKATGETVYLLPANATFSAPPEYDKKQDTVVWDGVSWQIKSLPNLPDPAKTLLQAKTWRIQQSKNNLNDYLETHPMLWTDGQYYSITKEKQNQLTSKIMAATMAQTLSQPYTLTWNSTGEVCKEWTLIDLSALAFAIDHRVTSLVTYQQTQEVAMRNAETQEELDAIVVDYDTVL